MTPMTPMSPMSPRANRLRRVALGVVLYSCAILLGIGSAWWVVKKAPWGAQSITVGAWTGSMLAGSPDANMYTRARIALGALLALGRDETMYFIATADDSGKPLRSRCSYRISGIPPKARWWSVTAYADDLYLFDAPNGHYSLNATAATIDGNGRFSLTTGPQEQEGVFWLPTPGDRGLVLALRLYNPEPELQLNPANLVAPAIAPLGACE